MPRGESAMKALVFLISIVLVAGGTSFAGVPLDLSTATCQIIGDGIRIDNALVIVNNTGYLIWLYQRWDPENLLFRFHNAQLGVDLGIISTLGTPPTPAGAASCTFAFPSSAGDHVEVSVTPRSGELVVAATVVGWPNPTVYLCFNDVNSYIVDGRGVRARPAGSSATQGWGGCGHLLHGNTYTGLTLKDFVDDQNRSVVPDFSKPFQIHFKDMNTGEWWYAVCDR
jgi:hypothetical protein